MLKIKVNNKYLFETEKRQEIISINSKPVVANSAQISADTFHLLLGNKSYRIKIIELNKAAKTCIIKVNNNTYNLHIENKFDLLLHELGLDNLNAQKVSDLKAPMPGLVLDILVTAGAQVKKGESLMVLEAMKMENSIKASSDLTVQSVKIKTGEVVKKNQVMMVFE